jgi:predicted nucleic acid-binding protein
MRELALDASVVLKWFDATEARYEGPARGLRTAYEAGRLQIGRRWRWEASALAAAATALGALRIEFADPRLDDVARWTARGLTAYDAAYVAVAEHAGVELVTDDGEILAVAPGIARPLAQAT